jgi:CDP-diglyceride synthetase
MHWSVEGKITTITAEAVIMFLDMIAYAIWAIYQAYRINRKPDLAGHSG